MCKIPVNTWIALHHPAIYLFFLWTTAYFSLDNFADIPDDLRLPKSWSIRLLKIGNYWKLAFWMGNRELGPRTEALRLTIAFYLCSVGWRSKHLFFVKLIFTCHTLTSKTDAFGTHKTYKYLWKKQGIRSLETVWCGIWSEGVIGRFFTENVERAVGAVNADHCLALLSYYFSPNVEQPSRERTRDFKHKNGFDKPERSGLLQAQLRQQHKFFKQNEGIYSLFLGPFERPMGYYGDLLFHVTSAVEWIGVCSTRATAIEKNL